MSATRGTAEAYDVSGKVKWWKRGGSNSRPANIYPNTFYKVSLLAQSFLLRRQQTITAIRQPFYKNTAMAAQCSLIAKSK